MVKLLLITHIFKNVFDLVVFRFQDPGIDFIHITLLLV